MAPRQQFDDPCKVRLKMVRLSYPHLFKAKGFGRDQTGEKKFSATAIIDPDTKAGKANMDLLDDAIAAAKEAKWGNKPPKLKGDKLCFRDGDDDADETKGMMVCVASNSKRPITLDENGDDVTEADDVLYGGCYVDMIVRIWAQDNEFGQRINASLEGVKYRDEGEAFSGHSKTSAGDFDDDGDDRGSRGRSRGRDDDDGDDRGSSRGGRRGSRDDDGDDDRGSRGRSRGRDDDGDDRGNSRGGRRGSRDDDGDDDRGGNSRGRGRDDDGDDDRGSRGRGRGRDDDGDDDRGSRGRGRDDDDDDRGNSRGGRRGGSKDEDKSERRRGSRDDNYDY